MRSNKRYEQELYTILPKIEKASSYLGIEPNCHIKNHKNISADILLAYPDLYEIGTGHLGLKILYGLINEHDDLCAERIFAPGDDFARELKKDKIPLFSLETKRAAKSFDIFGFTIPHELSYTTILHMLDLAKITIRAKDRGDNEPLIAGGGAGVFNPEPIAEFFDFFLLGDAEDIIEKVLRLAGKSRGKPRRERLLELAQIEGIYVPSFFDTSYNDDGTIKKIEKLEDVPSPKRIWIESLDHSRHPVDAPVPVGKTLSGRIDVEIDRGCTQGCRFCQAGTTYRPVRERKPEKVLELFDKSLAKSGYGNVSVTSLSAGDYSQIEPLLNAMMDNYSGNRIAVSLPSLRSATVTPTILEEIKRVKQGSLTIAPEAGSDRLRRVINKKASEEEITRSAAMALEKGWRNIKLYFMISLPTETDEDVNAIYELAEKLLNLESSGRRFSGITVSVSNFVPKSHTAFQWFGQNDLDTLIAKKEKLFGLIKKRRKITFRYHSPKMSHIEAVFSRGDKRLADSIEKAFNLGARFDAWGDKFDFDKWRSAFAETGIDDNWYACREINTTEILPWEHIDCGLTKKYFLREWKLASSEKLDGDCRTDNCLACGLDPSGCFKAYEWEPTKPDAKKIADQETYIRYRLTWSKKGVARFISHLEFKSALERAVRGARLRVAYTQGFSPRVKISLGPALPVGLESLQEFADFTLVEETDPSLIIDRLTNLLPVGIDIVNCEKIMLKEKSAYDNIRAVVFEMTFTGTPREDLAQSADKFNGAKIFPVTINRKGNETEIDLKIFVDRVDLLPEGGGIRYETKLIGPKMARPADMAKAFVADADNHKFTGRKIKHL